MHEPGRVSALNVRRPLFTPAAVIAGVMAPLFCLTADGLTIVTRGTISMLQDFYIFWAAARVLDQGGNPYDNAALTAVLKPHGLDVLLGSGYSYPLLLAEVLRPIGLLDPTAAAAVFVAVSAIGMGIAVALLVGSMQGIRWWLGAILGIFAGLAPAVSFGMFEGQSNMLVLPFLALAYREVAPGVGLAFASAVKLYPVSGFLAVAGTRRWRDLGAGLALTAFLIIGPALVDGRGGSGQSVSRLRELLAPDTYHTNMSINGFLSRAALNPGWPLQGVPVAAVDFVVVTLLGLLTLAVLWRVRFRPFNGALALAVWFGTVSAPKNSLWNFAPLLLALTFVLASTRRHPGAAAVAILGYFLTGAQLLIWGLNNPLRFVPEITYRSLPTTLGSGTALLGGLLIGGAVMAVLLGDASGADGAADGVDEVAVIGRSDGPGVEQHPA